MSKPVARLIQLGSILVVVILLVLGSYTYRRHLAAIEAGSRDLDRLLQGDSTISLVGLDVANQQRRIECTNKRVLGYLNQQLGNARRDEYGSGVLYQLKFRFSSGTQYEVSSYLCDDGMYLSVPSAEPVEGRAPTHRFIFGEPMSPEVKMVIEFLSSDWEDVAGLVLRLDDDGNPRFEYMPSLHRGNPKGRRVAEISRHVENNEPHLR